LHYQMQARHTTRFEEFQSGYPVAIA